MRAARRRSMLDQHRSECTTKGCAAMNTSSTHRNYFLKHWDGELPLGTSYWINGALVTVALSILITFGFAAFDASDAPRIYSVAAIASWILATGITLWQFVGIWRSAGRHVSRGGRAVWAALAKIAVGLGIIIASSTLLTTAGPQIFEYVKILSGKDPFGEYQLRVLRDATELEINGPIVFGLVDDVGKTLDAHPAITILHLNSIGGRIAEARKLHDLIDSRNLSTYTATACNSACTLAFIAGKERLIATSATLGFHQYSFPGTDPSAFASEYAHDKKYFEEKNVPRSFIDKAYSTQSTDFWKPTHNELLEAHVITGYANADQIAISGFVSRELESIDQELQKSALYVVLKQYEPEAYKEILTVVHSAVAQGKSMAAIRQSTLPRIVEVYKRRLPYAEDRPILDATRVLMDEMVTLYRVDPELCHAYLFPGAGSIPNFAQYFGDELVQRELDVMAVVIRSSATGKTRPPKEAAVEDQLAQIASKLALTHGDVSSYFTNPHAPGVDKKKVCEFGYDFYDHIIQLSPSKAGPLLRYIYSSE